MDFCEIASSSSSTCQPNLNMYDREAVPLTLSNHTTGSSSYSSPLHSPTSTTNSMMLPPISIQQPPQPHYHSNHVNSTSSSHHGREQHVSPGAIGVAAAPKAPLHQPGESNSPTEGIGIIDSDDVGLAQSSDGGSVPQVDSSNPKQAFVPCKVCGDKASGYHYGVTSCEGCKGFFRRSIQKQIEYRCLRDGKCLVIRLNRNRCQYCRFKKCLAVGMSRDSVRYGRVPKRSKSMDQPVNVQPQQQPNSTTQEQGDMASAAAAAAAAAAEQEKRHLAIYDVILTIAQSHHCHCLTTDDKVTNIHKKHLPLMPIKQELGSGNISTMEMLETHRCLMFSRVAELITPTIQNVVEFAKRIPGFADLAQDDQLMLIKAGFFETWLTHLARQFDYDEHTMMFSDGSTVSQNQMEIVLSPDLVSGMFSFAHSLSILGLNDTEVGLFTAIVLTSADRVSVVEPKSVCQIRERVVEALKLQLTRNHSSDPGLFAAVMSKQHELRAIGGQLNDLLDWFRHRWHRLHLPPLFAEIFDIPKSEDDLQHHQQQQQHEVGHQQHQQQQQES